MTTLKDFINDTLFLFGLAAALLVSRCLDWYQRSSAELKVCCATALIVVLSLGSMWWPK